MNLHNCATVSILLVIIINWNSQYFLNLNKKYGGEQVFSGYNLVDSVPPSKRGEQTEQITLFWAKTVVTTLQLSLKALKF